MQNDLTLKKTVIVFILIILFFICTDCLYAQYEPVVIGTSNLPTATAFNNSRKIVRDASDTVFVFYHDEVDGRPVIWTTHALHGVDWSEPEIFAYGSYPAVTISEHGDIYVAFVNEDGNGITIKKMDEYNSILVLEDLPGCKYPSIEADEYTVHVVWQQKLDSLATTNIFYQALNSYLFAVLTPVYQISTDDAHSIRPMIAGDLHFYDESFHIMWTDSLSSVETSLSYAGIYKEYADLLRKTMSDINNPIKMKIPLQYPYTPQKIAGTNGLAYPCFSVDHSSLFIASADIRNVGLVTAICDPSSDRNMIMYNKFFVKTQSVPYANTDDVIMPSCAIIWQDNNSIYYNQYHNDHYVKDDPIKVCTDSVATKRYLNVGYKLYRAYSFDNIWTEGDSSPYKVVYVRSRKSRYFHYMKFYVQDHGTLKPDIYGHENTYRVFNYFGGEGRVRCDLKEFSSELGDVSLEKGEYDDYYLKGTPTQSGTFQCSIELLDSDYPVNRVPYTFNIQVINNAPVFVSDSLVYVGPDDNFSYAARANDQDSNMVYCSFQGYPAWLTPVDSVLYGTVPINATDTSFTVIATDGELSDTMTVQVIIGENPLAVIDEKTPAEFALYQCHPNPFNPVTQISFDLPKAEQVELVVYNMNGQQVETLVSGFRPAGHYRVSWNAVSHPSGVYWYRITAGQYSAVKKMVLIK